MARLTKRQSQATLGCIGGGAALLFLCCGGLTILGIVTPNPPKPSRSVQPATPLLSAEPIVAKDNQPIAEQTDALASAPIGLAESRDAVTSPPDVTPAAPPESVAAPSPPAVSELVPTSDLRTWTDNTGSYTIAAAFVSATATQVTLRSEAGTEKSIPIDRLSESDQAYIKYATTEKHDPSAKLIIGYTSDVLDGDTLKIDDLYGESWTIRLEGIDTPENDQPYGLDARMALRRKVINKVCHIEWTEQDRYQRTLGFVYVGKHSVNQELVEEGWAWHYKKYSTDERLAHAETAARTAKIGLWKEPQRVAPWDWRNGVRVETAKPVEAPSIRTTDTTVYITKTGSKYHRSGCRYLSKSQIPIPLSRARSAYDACSRCNPP